MEIKLKSDFDIELLDLCGDDYSLARAAWVSTQTSKTKTPDDVVKLIPYLVKQRHGSPFEHGYMSFEIYAPLFIWREWHRHRIDFSYNEESARYTTLEPVFYIPPIQRPMFKVDNWKPGRPKFLTAHDAALTICEEGMETNGAYKVYKEYYDEHVGSKSTIYADAYQSYIEDLGNGLDPGLARTSLPVGIYSHCVVSCNPRSMMNFLSLRQHHPDARDISYPLWEINMCANQLEEYFKEYFPITHSAFVANGRVAP